MLTALEIVDLLVQRCNRFGLCQFEPIEFHDIIEPYIPDEELRNRVLDAFDPWYQEETGLFVFGTGQTHFVIGKINKKLTDPLI